MSNGTEFPGRGTAPAHPGRHRRGGAESWTPPLPDHRPVRHHATGTLAGPPAQGTGPDGPPTRPGLAPARAARPAHVPVDPPVSGSLPLPQPSFPQPSSTQPSSTQPSSTQPSLTRPSTQPSTQPLLPQPSLPRPSLPQPRDRRPAAPLFPAAHGSLPLDGGFGDDFEDDFAESGGPPSAESRADQAARRTRVSLAAPKPRDTEPEDDDVRIYAAPPIDAIDGLGGFTIGSVPASVTPPKTWRKAAWFATGASGAVVVGLLFAGSYLVGKPPVDQAVQGAWPGYQGAPTVVDPSGEEQSTTRHGGSAGGPESSSSRPDSAAGTTSGGGAGPVDGSAPAPDDDSSARPTTSGTATPSTTAPQKPPVTPAQRETPVKPPWWYSFPPDAQTMGDNSEKFFNTVTTDPGTASSVTTGDLHDQGPHALAERYAGIAYFEVRKISIDQERGVTVNTVEVTHTDGSKTIEERTLTFGDGDKIAADGQ